MVQDLRRAGHRLGSVSVEPRLRRGPGGPVADRVKPSSEGVVELSIVEAQGHAEGRDMSCAYKTGTGVGKCSSGAGPLRTTDLPASDPAGAPARISARAMTPETVFGNSIADHIRTEDDHAFISFLVDCPSLRAARRRQ